MTTISGVKFDILRTGAHNLIHIPQGAEPEDTLLDVQSVVRQDGHACEDMYMKVLNVSGSWVDATQSGSFGGFSFVTDKPGVGQQVAPSVGAATFMHFGIVDLKVVRGKTRSGVPYLNMFAKHLREANKHFPIGGILGSDDHTLAETPTGACGNKKVLSLLSSAEVRDRQHDEGSVAEAE